MEKDPSMNTRVTARNQASVAQRVFMSAVTITVDTFWPSRKIGTTVLRSNFLSRAGLASATVGEGGSRVSSFRSAAAFPAMYFAKTRPSAERTYTDTMRG